MRNDAEKTLAMLQRVSNFFISALNGNWRWREQTIPLVYESLDRLMPAIRKADIHAAAEYASFVDMAQRYFADNPDKIAQIKLTVRVSDDLLDFTRSSLQNRANQKAVETAGFLLATCFSNLGRPNLPKRTNHVRYRRHSITIH